MGFRVPVMGLFRGDGLNARAFRGMFFTIAIFGTQNALRLVSNLILTRLLFPEAFGLMAIVFTVQTGISLMADLGTRISIIQDADGDRPLFLDTAFAIQIVRGIAIAALIWIAAPHVAAFYEHEILAELLVFTGAAAILNGLISTKLPQSERNLELGRVAFVQITAQVIGLVATALLAWQMRSVWALVYGYLIGETATMILSHLLLRGHSNRPGFDRTYAWRMINFGVFIFLSSMAGFLIAQGDRAILGKIATLEELAFYNIGYFLAAVPLLLYRALIDRVLFPLYTKRPPWESEENRHQIARMRRLVTAGCFVGLMVLALVGVPLVVFLYDPRFEPAGPYAVLVALALMPSVVTNSYSFLALADGNSRRFALITVGAAIVQTLGMLAGGQALGVLGVVLGIALAPILWHPVALWLLRRYRGWDPLHDAAFLGLMAVFVFGLYEAGFLHLP